MLILLKSGNLNLLEPSEPVQACNGVALSLPVEIRRKTNSDMIELTLGDCAAYDSASYRYDSQRRQDLLSRAWTDRGGWYSMVPHVFELCKIICIQVFQEECARLQEGVPYVKIYRCTPKHLYPKLNGYGDNGQRSSKLWQLLHTYWLPNTY